MNKPPDHPDAETKGLLCGNCQWFSAGFDGNNCHKIRKVEIDTVACIEHTKVMADYFHSIINDKYIEGLRNAIQHPKFKINAETLIEELKGYQISDDISKYRVGTQQRLEVIDQLLARVISYRSRVSQIYTTLIDIQYDIKQLLSYSNLWLHSKYQVIRDLKNEQARSAAQDRILPEFLPITKNIDKVMAIAKHVDEKLTENEWTLKAILSGSEKLWQSQIK